MPPDYGASIGGSFVDNRNRKPKQKQRKQQQQQHYQHQQFLSPPPAHPPTRKQEVHRQSSFASLAKVFRLGAFARHAGPSMHDDSTGEDDEADDHDEEADEESLLWDAQAVIVAHQPALAMQRYTMAALPPHCSAQACLAIGNLLTRGTIEAGDSPSTNRDSSTSYNNKGKAKATAHLYSLPSPSLAKIFGSFFRPSTTPECEPPSTPPPLDTFDVVGNGWKMRKEGKRAVRNVETMGVAGGWFVLGLGWIVQEELQRQSSAAKGVKVVEASTSTSSPVGHGSDDDHDQQPIMMGSTYKTQTSAKDELFSGVGSTPSPSDTVDTVESSVLCTPESGLFDLPSDDDELKKLRLVYELLQPLLKLYRHGHIQVADPVFLPPITPKQLPSVLRPAGDLQKGRNAWVLGGVVAAKLVSINALKAVYDTGTSESTTPTLAEKRQFVIGIRNLANYILGMTSSPHVREVYFRAIATTGPCGLEVADQVVAQAERRLHIIEKTPLEQQTPRSYGHQASKDGYPFPHMSPASGYPEISQHPQSPSALSMQSLPLPRPRRISSSLSLASTRSKKTFEPTPAKSTVSPVSPANEQGPIATLQAPFFAERPRALETLRKVSAASLRNPTQHRREASAFSVSSILSGASFSQPESEPDSEGRPRWPALSGWTMAMATPPQEEPDEPAPLTLDATDESEEPRTARPSTPIPPAKAFQSSPPSPMKHVLVQRRAISAQPSSASLLSPKHEIATIDPALAAAELASALTKHVCCSVCAVKGVNFPECRKCGMRFCSRDCRIGEHAAGNGKRHVCGLWESRRQFKGQDSAAQTTRINTASPRVRAF